jgi:hypothetical protein
MTNVWKIPISNTTNTTKQIPISKSQTTELNTTFYDSATHHFGIWDFGFILDFVLCHLSLKNYFVIRVSSLVTNQLG